MNIIVLAIKPMEPEDTRFPVRVEFNWGAGDDIVGNSVITVEAWLDKGDLGASVLSEVHDAAITAACRLMEKALDAAPTAKVITGF